MKKVQQVSRKWCRSAKKFFVTALAMLSMASTMAVPASAVTINPNATTETVVGGILDVIFKLAFWTGAVITVIGVFMFLYSFKDDRGDLQASGAKTAIVGAALLGLRLLVGLTGLIS